MTDTVVYTGAELAAEVVKLKQEVAELRATVDGLLRDHDGNYSPTLKPRDVRVFDTDPVGSHHVHGVGRILRNKLAAIEIFIPK